MPLAAVMTDMAAARGALFITHYFHNMMKNGNVSSQSSILSQTITFLRLPLIVAVVYIHTNPGHVVLDGTAFSNM